MDGFSDLSDTEDSAVEEIIAQAQDLCVLEQVSAINCSGFTDSVLPTELESRFRKLKSFPVTKKKHRASAPLPYTGGNDNINSKTHLDNSFKGKAESNSLSDEEIPSFSHSKWNRGEKMCFDHKSRSGCVSSPSDSLNFSKKKANFSPVKENSDGKKAVKAKSKHGSVSLPSGSSISSGDTSSTSYFKQKPDEKSRAKLKSFQSFSSPLSSSNSPSPPRNAGCFWCSPKKVSKKKSKENWDMGIGLDWDKNDELVSDLGSFSTKERQKMLKKAMKDEEKISREAEKIVKWAKQASCKNECFRY
ncbi:Vitellogenin-2 protein [Quillaja saponaria]|uniref:Vitellogenin-2 protein n=1 Tax=Quillaja saponaria TaxID=32244 RepID=A0AAD7PF53_QUISA|nr:Vitellogenin-2 protein [Quillaja saponaria]